MIHTTGAFTKAVIWQEGDGESSIGEPALLVSVYQDVVCIRQESRDVNINYETIPELIRLLREIKREHDAGATE